MEEESLNSTPISSHQADKLRKQALEVHALLAKFNETFTTDTSEHYYILSKRYLNARNLQVVRSVEKVRLLRRNHRQ